MPRNTRSGGVYIEINGNIEPFKQNLQRAQDLAKTTARNIQNATDKFFNEHQINKTLTSLSRNLLNIKATAIACQKDISLFSRHFERIGNALGLAGKQAQAFGKDMENALKVAKQNSLERSLRSLQQQIGLTDQAYMRLASSMGATEAAMKKAQSVLNVRTYSQIKEEIKKVAEAYNQFAKSGKAAPNDIKRAHEAAVASIRRLGAELRSTTNELQREEKAAKGLLSSISKSTLVFLGGFVTTHAIVQDIKSIVSASFEAATALDRLKLAYSSIYGGAAEGKKQLDFIYEQANKTGQEFMSLAESAKTFFAAGQNSTIKNEMNDIFKSVNLAGAALQLSASQMQRIYYAIGQMISKGKVSAEEMRQQLGEQLPSAFQIAAKAMGVTTAELDKMMADGKLMTEDFLPKFSKALYEHYGQAGMKASETMQGALNKAKAEFELFKASLIDSKMAVTALKSIADVFTKLKDVVNDGTLATIGKTIVNTGLALTTASVLFGTAGIKLVGSLSSLVAFLGGPYAVAIAAAIGGITYLANTEEASAKINNQYKDSFSSAEEAVKNFNGSIKNVTEDIKNLSQTETRIALKKNIKDYNDLLDEASRYINRYVDENGYMVKAHDKLTITFREVWEGLKSGNITYDEAALKINALSGENAELAKKYLDMIYAMERNRNANKELTDTLDGTAKKFAGMISVLNSVSNAALEVAQAFQTARAAAAGNWSVNVKDFESAIKAMDKQIIAAEANIAGLDKLMPIIDALGLKETDLDDLKKCVDLYGKKGLAGAAEVLGEKFEALDQKGKDYLDQLLKRGIKLVDVLARQKAHQEELLKLQNKRTGGATKAANAQIDYNKTLKDTQAELEAVEEKLTHSSIEKVEKQQIEIAKKYKKEVDNINASIDKLINSKKISSAQGEELRKLQLTVAERKRDLALQESQEKQREQEMQHLQTQIGFYNELAELSGEYEKSAELRIRLIDLEAEKFKNIKGIPADMIEAWKEFKKLQASTDWFDGAVRGLKKFTAEYGDSAKQWENITYNFAKDFESNIHKMFDDFIDTGKVSFDSLAQMFKNLLKQMAYQALVQPIVLSVVNGVSSALYGGTSATTGGTVGAGQSAGGLGNTLTSAAVNWVTGKATGSVMEGAGGGISAAINGTAASLFPSTFATSSAVANANFGSNAVVQAMTGNAGTLPTYSATQLFNPYSMGGGLFGGIGANILSSQFFGNSTGTSIGSSIGSALGSIGSMAAASFILGNSWNPIGWGGAIVAGIGSLLGGIAGGGIGSLFGGYEDEPGYYINAWTDLTNKKGLSGYKKGTATQNHRWDSFTDEMATNMRENVARPLMEQFRDTTFSIKEQLETVGGKSLGESFFASVRKQQGSGDKRTGKNGIELSDYFHIHGEWHDTNSPDYKKWVEEAGEQYQKVMVTSIANMDMAPITKAADGAVANTWDEIAEALAKAGSLISLGTTIEDEDLQKTFNEGISKSLVKALKKLDTSKLGLDIDKSTIEGWAKASQAMATWQEVNATIEGMLNPVSEVSAQFTAIGEQFAAWEGTLSGLGWQANKVKEIDKKRIEYVKKYADEVMKGFEPQNEYLAQVKKINDAFNDVAKGLEDHGINEKDIEKVKQRRDKVIRDYVDGIIEPFKETNELQKNIESIANTFDNAIAAMKEATDTFTQEEIKNAKALKKGAVEQAFSDELHKYDAQTVGTELEQRLSWALNLDPTGRAIGHNDKKLSKDAAYADSVIKSYVSSTVGTEESLTEAAQSIKNLGEVYDSLTESAEAWLDEEKKIYENSKRTKSDEARAIRAFELADAATQGLSADKTSAIKKIGTDYIQSLQPLNEYQQYITSISSTIDSIIAQSKAEGLNDKKYFSSLRSQGNKAIKDYINGLIVDRSELSESEKALKEINDYWNTIIDAMKSLSGVFSAKDIEAFEKKRDSESNKYLEEQQKAIEEQRKSIEDQIEGRKKLSDTESALKGINNFWDGIIESMKALPSEYGENDFANIEKKRAEEQKQYFEDQKKSIEEQIATRKKLNDTESALKGINDFWDSIIEKMKGLSYSEAKIIEAEQLRAKEQQDYLSDRKKSIEEQIAGRKKLNETESAIKEINDFWDGIVNEMKEMASEYSQKDFDNIEKKRAKEQKEYISEQKKAVKATLDSYKVTNELQKSLDSTNEEFDTMIAKMKELGMSAKEVAAAEKQRTKTLAKLRDETMRSYDQSLYLRYLALQSGTESSQYQLVNLLQTQQNELSSLEESIGKDNDEYATTVMMQSAEMLNLRISLLQNQLKTALQEQLDNANEQLNTATDLKNTFESILRNLQKARKDLWTSDKNLATSRYDEAYKQFNETYTKAMGGDEEALNELPSIADTLLNLAKEQLNTRGEYDTAFYNVSKKLKKAEDYAASQLAAAESTISEQERLTESLNAQINSLDNSVTNAITESVESLQGMIAQYQAQLTALLKKIADNSDVISNNTSLIELLNDGTGTSQQAILETKAQLMKYGEALGGDLKAGNYTSDFILASIKANGMSFDEWFRDYGSKEIAEAAKHTGVVVETLDDLKKITKVYDDLLAAKADSLNKQMVSSAEVAAGGWTSEKVLNAITRSGLTVYEWWEQFGRNEGFTLQAAATTNEAIDENAESTSGELKNLSNIFGTYLGSRFVSVDEMLEAKVAALNAEHFKNKTWTREEAVTLMEQLYGSVENWFKEIGSTETWAQSGAEDYVDTETILVAGFKSQVNAIDSLSSEVGGFIGLLSSHLSSVIGDAANGIKSAIKSISTGSSGSSSSSSSSTSSSSTSSNFAGSKYKTAADLIKAKRNALNAAAFGGRKDWTSSEVEALMIKTSGSVAQWYKDFGKAEGFASGGITPKNKAFWVGEKGPELLLSPQNYGILNNRDSIELMRNTYANQSNDYEESNELRANTSETNSILRQILRKLNLQEYKIEKIQRIFEVWDNEGIPATAS